ncbi:hypothetical protein [Streptomyces sp. H27-C3]|uniref:hypothetical protein n=1 Tax=Streptomyces sp. H27-C3 TaxID=3046305 RepID=UPI0024BA81CD|nr:hypothetical protein [Streptomyces sp. H27-C3]MDJ0461988.1 hypothetical protein [Streptomyces sp. H27-C3]
MEKAKTCSACGNFKPPEEFPASGVSPKTGEVKRNQPCKACKAARQADRRKADATEGKARDHAQDKIRRRAKLLGISAGELNALMDRACGVCGVESNAGWQRNSAYQHPITGKLVGTVCTKCASGIGYLGHDPARIARALKLVQ